MAKKDMAIPDPDADAAQKTKMTETTVPVNVGMDKDAMAVAETQNRQVGVDDSKEIRETLHDAAVEHGTTVDIPVQHPAGEALPEAAKAAIANEDAPDPTKPGSRTAAAAPGPAPAVPQMAEVTVNGRTYSWRIGEERAAGIPQEAIDIWNRMVDANTP